MRRHGPIEDLAGTGNFSGPLTPALVQPLCKEEEGRRGVPVVPLKGEGRLPDAAAEGGKRCKPRRWEERHSLRHQHQIPFVQKGTKGRQEADFSPNMAAFKIRPLAEEVQLLREDSTRKNILKPVTLDWTFFYHSCQFLLVRENHGRL